MAKKKNKEELEIFNLYTPPKFYVYYDNKTGQIFSVTNETTDRYEYGFEAELSEIENFLTGDWKFIDYVVGYKRLPDNTTILGVMPKINEEYSFRNNVFEWITQSDDDCDLTVIWDKPNKLWKFKLKPGLTERFKNLLTPRLVFFVTLEGDFDFLIRTIYIDTERLLEGDVTIPFEHDIENKLDKVSISSKLVFDSYGLKVADE